MVKRQLPNPNEISELFHFKTPELNPRRRCLNTALTIQDLRKIVKRRTPAAAFDYTDGAAESEVPLRHTRQAFRDIELYLNILRPIADVDAFCETLGGRSSVPFGIAPAGFARLMQTEGEVAGAGAAGAAEIPFTLSTLGTTSVEDVKAANPHERNWLQLYIIRQCEISHRLIERITTADFDAPTFTADTPVAGTRLRDEHNDFSISPQITAGTILSVIPRPWWWSDFLTMPKLEFASLKSIGGTVGELPNNAMDPTISDEDPKIIHSMWSGRIIIKGIQAAESSKRLVGLGVNDVLLSNHSGRQLDRTPVPSHLLPRIAWEVGRGATIAVGASIMSGADVMTAVTLDARFELVSRAYLYGFMTGGRESADRMIEILSDEAVHIMRLLDVSSLDELKPCHVTQLTHLTLMCPNIKAIANVLARWGPRPA